MTEFQKTIHELTTHSKKNVELASVLYKVIEAAPKEDHAVLFKQALLEFKYTSTDNDWQMKPVFETEQEKFVFLEKAKSLMDWDLLPRLRQQKLCENDFDKKVWEYISETKTTSNEKERYALMYACLSNESLPYINKENMLTMTNDEFGSSIDDINPTIIAQVEHIFKQDFEQITEDASLFLRLFEECKSEKEKAILFSIILIRFKRKIMRGMLSTPLDGIDDE